MTRKKLGTIQVDLDGLWTNLEYYGHKAEVIPDQVFESSIPRFLDLFERHDVKATFFLVGKDGEVDQKKKLVKELVKAGHEIANHTYSHTFGLRNLTREEKIKEIEKGEAVIKKITGKNPVGFKAPGYDVDPEILRLLEKKGYLYDSSIIPTFAYPLIMSLNRLISGGIKRTHGPKLVWGLAPNKPYHPSLRTEWKQGKSQILELPCSVMPLFRLPYHFTFATKFGMNYFNFAYNLAKRKKSPLNYEFHAADLSDNITDKRMAHLESISFKKRNIVFNKILKKITKDYKIITSQDLAKRINQRK
jgi:peptidoglycan-N-acetylglucosamine deacetylase